MKGKNEKGEVMLESLIVYTITIFLLFFILAIFSVLFQRWNIQVIANESATRVAQTYRFSTADTVTGQVEEKDITNVEQYRYVFSDDELELLAEDKIQEYAKQRLQKTTFTKNVTEPVITATVIHDGMARRHIEVTIKGEYSVPFGQALSYFGFDSTTVYETKAYAECLDLSDYINTVDFVEDQVSLSQFNSKFVKMVNKILKLFDNIFN